MEGGNGIRCVLFKSSWVIVVDYSLKASHVSTRKKLMWAGLNLSVPWFFIQFIIELPYKLLSFKFGPLLFLCSCIESLDFKTNSCMY